MRSMVCKSMPLTMEVSNFHSPPVKPRLNLLSSSGKGIQSIVSDLNFTSFNWSCVVRHPSSQSMKQHNLVLAHSFRQGNGVGILPNHCHCIWSTATYTPLRTASRSHSFRPCQVKSEDPGGALSGESITLDEQTLEQELKIAIKEENYVQAAKIRDSLRLLKEDGKASVLAANARFYNSFRNGDLAAMQALWAKGENVCVVHPGVSGISGYDLVMGSWEFVWADYEFPLQIELKDIQVHVRGDLGYVTCIEMVKTKGNSWGRQFATNVFEKIDGQWFICIHHASYVDL